MNHRTSRSTGPETRQDIGTLWMMRRLDSQARCALLARGGGWELCVLVDGVSRLTQQCACPSDAFNLGKRWKLRMLQQGWVPRRPHAI